jgi:hypothetical protein
MMNDEKDILEEELEEELEALLEELAEVNVELGVAFSGYASAIVTIVLNLALLMLFHTWDTFFVSLIWMWNVWSIFIIYDEEWNLNHTYREEITSQISELQKRIQMNDHCP